MKAYRRDASWYSRPDVTTPKRAHLEREAGELIAACSRQLPLVDETGVEAERVPASARCRRPGCARLWREVAP